MKIGSWYVAFEKNPRLWMFGFFGKRGGGTHYILALGFVAIAWPSR